MNAPSKNQHCLPNWAKVLLTNAHRKAIDLVEIVRRRMAIRDLKAVKSRSRRNGETNAKAVRGKAVKNPLLNRLEQQQSYGRYGAAFFLNHVNLHLAAFGRSIHGSCVGE